MKATNSLKRNVASLPKSSKEDKSANEKREKYPPSKIQAEQKRAPLSEEIKTGKIKCPECKEKINVKDINEHRDTCPKNQVICQYCKENFSSRIFHSHVNICSERYKSPTNTEHQRIGSPISDPSMRVCPLCKGSFEDRIFQSHKNVCSTNPSPANTQTRFNRNGSTRNLGRQQPDGPNRQEAGPSIRRATTNQPDHLNRNMQQTYENYSGYSGPDQGFPNIYENNSQTFNMNGSSTYSNNNSNQSNNTAQGYPNNRSTQPGQNNIRGHTINNDYNLGGSEYQMRGNQGLQFDYQMRGNQGLQFPHINNNNSGIAGGGGGVSFASRGTSRGGAVPNLNRSNGNNTTNNNNRTNPTGIPSNHRRNIPSNGFQPF